MFSANRFCFILAFSASALFVYAQNTPHFLDSLLTQKLNDQRSSLNVKGLSAAIHFSDSNIWTGVSGVSSANTPLDSSFTFGIASITKTVTAACILQMADESLLHLDDSLHEWLDTIPFINPNITPRQLLRHQSGIYDVVAAPTFQNVLFADQDSIWQLVDVVSTFIDAPYFQPGAGFRYSNTNFILLGMVVEKVSGLPYYEVFRQRFLEPWGLQSFSMAPFESSANNIAHAWLDLNGDGVMDDAHNLLSNWQSFDAATGPAGSYYATPSDLSKWIWLMMRGGLVTTPIWEQAITTVNTTFSGGTRYGLGLMERNFLGHKGYGHGGDSGYSGSAWYFPDLDISIVVLNNDASKNSWQLVPVVQALLKGYLDYQLLTETPEPDASSATVVFPNPFTGELHVAMDLAQQATEVNWKLVDVNGRLVSTATMNDQAAGYVQTQLPGLGQLPEGLYCLSGYANGRLILSKKVLKR